MNAGEIAVCTTTFYPKWEPGPANIRQLLNGDRADVESKMRGDLALKTLKAVLRNGYRLVLVDGADGSAFQETLKKKDIPFMQETAHGMSPSRVQAFDAAYDDPHIQAVTWTEPEKVGMVEEIERCAEPVLNGEAAVVIPARTEVGWQSLPSYQRRSEEKGNRFFNHQLHKAHILPETKKLDMYFGTRVYSARQAYRAQLREILHRRYSFNEDPRKPLHAEVNPGAYSEATFFPPVAGLHEGVTVLSVPTNFVYPQQQCMLEEYPPFAEGPNGYNKKRDRQLIDISTGLVHYLRLIGVIPGASCLERRLDS